MILVWPLRAITGNRMGLFGFLASWDHNRSQLKLERVRQEASTELINCLPCGAVYREGAGDCWREIRMPSAPSHPLFVLPVIHHESAFGINNPVGPIESLRTPAQDLLQSGVEELDHGQGMKDEGSPNRSRKSNRSDGDGTVRSES